MKPTPYREGSWFAVPLRQCGYAIGVVARVAPKGRIILTYLFGPKRDVLPTISELNRLRAEDALRCIRAGDLGLIKGEWPIIGESPNWVRDDWPMPLFVRRDSLSKRAWHLHYSDSDPSKLEREEPASYQIDGLEESDLYGSGAVEIMMTKLLNC